MKWLVSLWNVILAWNGLGWLKLKIFKNWQQPYISESEYSSRPVVENRLRKHSPEYTLQGIFQSKFIEKHYLNSYFCFHENQTKIHLLRVVNAKRTWNFGNLKLTRTHIMQVRGFLQVYNDICCPRRFRKFSVQFQECILWLETMILILNDSF